MPTERKTIAVVVGHKDADDRQHLGKLVKLIVEGQDFNMNPLTRVYAATIPSKGMQRWWERLRSLAEDKQIHVLR
ncbi:hypothetical protein RWE87_13815 [Sinorhizobium meliloti]|uniref:hypothetical protein n=1 Tax=Rhizobium meliloti TaxID=382 RepID=UPI00299F2553|nr:hypothetical protein [Sinorhizobium meliloti]